MPRGNETGGQRPENGSWKSAQDCDDRAEQANCALMNRDTFRLGLLQAIALLAATVLVYWPSLRGGFVWDDLFLVKKNVLVTGDLNLFSVWFRGDFPLATVTTWVQWLVFGDQTAGYRVVNALLHGLSALLLWRVLEKMKMPGAWLAAALFAVHPVCVASVAWISELKNTLSLPFYLLSIWSYLIFTETDAAVAQGRRRLFYVLSVIGFVLALTAKTSTVMLPVVLLACVWWQRTRSSMQPPTPNPSQEGSTVARPRKLVPLLGGDRGGFGDSMSEISARGILTWLDLLRLSPHFVLGLVFGLMTIWFQKHGAIQGVTVQTESFAGRLAGAGMAFWFYAGKALLPLNLSMIYPRWDINAPNLVSFLPLMALLLGLGAGWRFRQSWGRPTLLALGCFGVSLFPVLGLIDMYFLVFSRVSDHFAYLPLLVVTAGVAAAVSRIPRRQISRGIGLAMILGLALLTWQRAHVFASDEALWRDTVAKNPNSWNAHNNLACNLAERGDLDAAMKHFVISLELNPGNASAHRNLAKALAIQGRWGEAASHWRTVIELKPSDAEARADYAEVLRQLGRPSDAIRELREAVRLDPKTSSRSQLGLLLAGTGQYAAAANEFREFLAVQPESVEIVNNLAWLLATCADKKLRNGQEAVRLATIACELTEHKEPIPYGTLAAAYAENGDFINAGKASQRAIDLAHASGNEPLASRNGELLKIYQAGRSYPAR